MRQQILTGLGLALVFSGLCSFTYVEKFFGTSQCYEEGVSVVSLPNGNYLVSGAYNCTSNISDWKGYLLLLDADGDTIWSQRNLQANGKVKPTIDGSFVFIGGNTAGQAYDTIHISKANQTGSVIWTKSFLFGVCKNTVTDVVSLNDGYLVSGFYASQTCINPTYDAFVMKLDLNGDLVWKQSMEGSQNEQLYVVKPMADGSIVALGWTNSDNDTYNVDYLLVKLDGSGGLAWRKNIGNEYDNYAYGMEVTPRGDIMIAGYTANMELTKTDDEGNVLWKKEYGPTGGSSYFKVSNTVDGGFAVLGSEMVNGQSQAVFMKTNDKGQVLWKKNWNARLREFKEKGDGSFVLTGYAQYLPDMVVIMMDTTRLTTTVRAPVPNMPMGTVGSIIPEEENTVDEESITAGTGQLAGEPKQAVKVYPNPADNELTMTFDNPEGKPFTLQVFDVVGQLVSYTDYITTGQIQLNRGNLVSGMYTYKLSYGNETYAGKFMFH